MKKERKKKKKHSRDQGLVQAPRLNAGCKKQKNCQNFGDNWSMSKSNVCSLLMYILLQDWWAVTVVVCQYIMLLDCPSLFVCIDKDYLYTGRCFLWWHVERSGIILGIIVGQVTAAKNCLNSFYSYFPSSTTLTQFGKEPHIYMWINKNFDFCWNRSFLDLQNKVAKKILLLSRS